MVNDEATPLVIDIARSFISLVREIEPSWRKAYLRFCLRDSVSEAKGSYVHESGVDIIDVVKHKDFFHPVAQKGQDLLAALGKTEGVFLLVTDSSFDYEIKFEYQDLNRWRISKLGGGTGVPSGIE
ncbi:hypothetical protein [Silvimonas sp.]|uniref:hypothetical protein n=1 Tax=Silvimonas sp. TaxID=2650811 RepID=UPI0028410E9F|nr:hypothetical protein [Silvimonas sp.]MDR3428742.1 hypothetical protein [Silvimonas sp.]